MLRHEHAVEIRIVETSEYRLGEKDNGHKSCSDKASDMVLMSELGVSWEMRDERDVGGEGEAVGRRTGSAPLK